MEYNKELFDKFEELNKFRRKQDPLCVEMDKIVGMIYPIKPIEDIFKLGQAYMLSWIVNNLYKHLAKHDKEMFDYIIEEYKKDEVTKNYLNKLIKPEVEFD